MKFSRVDYTRKDQNESKNVILVNKSSETRNVDIPAGMDYAYFAFGRDRHGGALRTPSGPRGSSGKEVASGVADKPARTFFYTP